MAQRALITGITGQDGSYLAELLLAKDYEVIALGDPVFQRPMVSAENAESDADALVGSEGRSLDRSRPASAPAVSCRAREPRPS